MAGHEWEDWFEREEFIGQISDIRVQNLQVERELVQKRTFTRWMNLHLEKCDPPVEVQDLFRDIQDGHVLMALLEELSGCKLLHGFKKSSHRIFRLNNIAKVLSFLEERNVKLVSIDAADVADGNSSIILGLIWNIILFFQIKELTGNIRSQFPSSSSLSSIPTSSDSSYAASHEGPAASSAVREHGKAIKKLLQWVQKRTRKFGVAVKDFGKSWTSGLAFLAVIKSIDSSLVDMRKAMLRSTKDNLEDAFRIAHYSLGIPRLLEPEDVTINAPDEQSIMTYVSQFLEHFPGMEEPEETSQLIARSVSMSRLNFRDTESNRTRTSRVKEASSMFQRGSARPPPKILISSVSEDRSVMSASFRPPAARSWSSEDFLADHPHMDVVDVEESSSEVLTDSPSHSPQPSHSPTALESVNTESVVGDSAISSPDSEFGGMPEKFSESRSDSSLCDSGMSWDVYRATPVEVTSCDEGWSVTESYMDEGIYSLSSLDSNQERLQGQSDKNFVDVEKDVIFDNNQDAAFMQLPDHSNREMNKEVGSQAVDTSQSREQEPGLRDTEELIKSSVGTHPETEKSDEPQLKHTNEEERTSTEQERLSNIDAQDQEGQLNGGTESERNDCDSVITESPKDSLEFGVLQEWSDGAGHTQDDAIEGVVRNTKESFSSETSANTHPSSQDGSSETTLVQESAVPLISVSSEGQDAAGNDEPEGTDAGVISLKTELNSNDSVEVPSCLVPDHTSMENKEICGQDASHNVEISESRQECELLDAEKDLMFQIPPTDTESHSMNTDQERVSAGRLLGHQNKLGDEVASARENILDPVNLNVNGRTDVWSYQPQSVSRDVSNADIDPPKEDGAGVEPMDLFYPDKEESVCPEPLDTEMQSWPSVLSVSALQPAPTSETPAVLSVSALQPAPTSETPAVLSVSALQPAPTSETPAVLSVSALQPAPTSETPADEHDFRDGLESTLGNKKEDDEVSAAHEHGLFLQEDDEHGLFLQEDDEHGLVLGEKTGAVWSGDALEDGSENAESMSKQHEDQTAPVLRHRKGLHFTDRQTAAAATTHVGDSDSDLWLNEVSVLLLLWLLLYCFWLLPQMDLKSLPSLLMNV